MTPRTHLMTTAATLALLGTSAGADVTGPEVWEDWKSYMRGFGYEMSGTEVQSGDTLTVSDVAMRVVMPEGEGNLTITMGQIAFIDNAGGTVTVQLPDEVPMEFDMRPTGDDAAQFTLLFSQAQPDFLVSGDADDMTYTYTADSLSMVMDGFEVDGAPVPDDMMAVSFALANVSNITRMQVADLRNYTQTLTADSMSYKISANPPESEGGGSFDYEGQIAGLDARGTGALPLELTEEQMADVDAMLDEGFDFDAGFAFTGGNGRFEGVSPDGAMSGTTSSTGGEIKIAMGQNGLTYDVSQTGTKVDMQVPQFPLPISLEMAVSAFNLTLPVRPGDEGQDFAFGFTFGDFTISDAIWGIFDPAGQLPRDPATVALDLTGKAKVTTNVFDPEAAASMAMGQSAGELNALDVNRLEVSAVGASLTGQGAFTFDNSDTSTFGGMPRPNGGLDLRVAGANGLIDTLVNMGFLPQEQAMGARMMMGLFGVPQGDDVLTSRIEVNEQGHVLANGQRIR